MLWWFVWLPKRSLSSKFPAVTWFFILRKKSSLYQVVTPKISRASNCNRMPTYKKIHLMFPKQSEYGNDGWWVLFWESLWKSHGNLLEKILIISLRISWESLLLVWCPAGPVLPHGEKIPSHHGVTTKMPQVEDVLHWPTSHPIFSYWVG